MSEENNLNRTKFINEILPSNNGYGFKNYAD